jgi:hypothetical protein
MLELVSSTFRSHCRFGATSIIAGFKLQYSSHKNYPNFFVSVIYQCLYGSRKVELL